MLQQKYTVNQRMSDLINDDVTILLIVSRFGLSLGFENKTVKEVCELNGIDTDTFLTVVNFLSEDNFEMDNTYEKISIEALVSFLKNGHKYFLGYKLPAIRSKLLSAIDKIDLDRGYKDILLRFFDDYVQEVFNHMHYEDEVVFPYVLSLLKGAQDSNYNIQMFEDRHNQIDQKLAELKNILIKYYPVKAADSFLLTDVLLDIFFCERDLAMHNKVEDYMFVPAIEAIENQMKDRHV